MHRSPFEPESSPVRDALRRAGIHVEKRDAAQLTRLCASAAGSAAAQLLAHAYRLGPIGTAAALLGGAVLGDVAATHRVYYEPPAEEDGPPSPAAWSDRR